MMAAIASATASAVSVKLAHHARENLAAFWGLEKNDGRRRSFPLWVGRADLPQQIMYPVP